MCCQLHERIVRWFMIYKLIGGIWTEHVLVFSMEVDYPLMLQLYVAIAGPLFTLLCPSP